MKKVTKTTVKEKVPEVLKEVETVPPASLPVPSLEASPASVPSKPMRQILIETDGDNIRLVFAQVGGSIELIGIFQSLIEYLRKKTPGTQ